MSIHIIPSYNDIFQGSVPNPEELLYDVPSDLVLNLLAFINTQIMLGPDSLEHHVHIFNLLTDKLKHIAPNLPRRINKFIERHQGKVRIFGTPYLLDFIQYELEFFRQIPGCIDTNPDQSVRILKAYFVFVDLAQAKIYKNTKLIKHDPQDKFWFQRRTWPLAIEQFEIHQLPQPGIFAVKAFAFFKYFRENSKFKNYINTFLEETNQASCEHYITHLLNLISFSLNEPNKNWAYIYSIKNDDQSLKTLLDHLSTDQEKFKAVQNHSKNHNGLRSGPLFNFRSEYYVILNWHFLYQKLYKGLVFDFYNRSGIDAEFKSLPDYLSFIARKITEHKFFQPMMQQLLKKNHTILEIDNENSDGKPDLYYRDCNKILLAELKDITLSAESITDYTFESLASQLERKLIKNEKGAKKGVLQLINHIKLLNEEIPDYDIFTQNGIKKHNIKVFPVIIYTNSEYSLIGIEDYIRKRFDEELETYRSKATFWNIGEVHDLVMLDFDFLLRALAVGEKFDWFDLIREYNKRLDRRLKNFNKNPSTELSLKLFPGFSRIHQGLWQNKKPDIEQLFKVFDIQI